MAKIKTVQELEIENRISIPEYFNKVIVPRDKRFHNIDEANTTSICPFHHENDPSWHYWVKHKMFHCFGCGVSGNVIKLHQLARRQFFGEYISYEVALNQLIAMYGLQNVIQTLAEDQVVLEQPKTAFEKARDTLVNGMEYRVPPDKMTLTGYRTRNKQILISEMPLQSKLNEFNNLDILAGLILRDDVLN